ncbi:DUF7503 family protein [Halosegnis longus]
MKDTIRTHLKNSPRLTAVLLTTLLVLSQITGSVAAMGGITVSGP